MNAPDLPPGTILRSITREVEFLRELLWRRLVSGQEFALCRILAETRGEAHQDIFFDWVMDLTPGQMEAYRATLRERGLIVFVPGVKLGSFSYQVLDQPPQRAILTGLSQPPRWVVSEHGERAHLLQDDDFFPAERAVCGLSAVDAEQRPLPRFNSRPADYQFCCKCHLLHDQLKGGQSQ